MRRAHPRHGLLRQRRPRYADAIRVLKRLLSKVASSRRRGYWTPKLSVDLEHMARPNESLLIAEGGVLDPWVRAGSKIALQRRVLRLSKPPRCWKVPSYADSVKRNITEVVTWTELNNLCLGCIFYCLVNIEGRPLNCETGAKYVFYGYDGEFCGVEQLALQYYTDEGGGWQDDFYKLRKDLIESQLKRIQDGMAVEMLISSWELHQGTSCGGVNWDRHSLTNLRAALHALVGIAWHYFSGI